MEDYTIFLDLLAILLTARVFAELAARLGVPPVIGELCAGVLLGPSILGLIEINDSIHLLAEIGIVLLLFEIGIQTDLHRLSRTGGKSLVVASGGFILPLIFGYAICYHGFHFSLLVSLFVGGTLTATSIGITMRVMVDLGKSQSQEGRIVLGAAVFDDILGVALLSLLYEFAFGGGISLLNAGKIMLFAGVFFILAPSAAKIISRIIKNFEDTSGIPGLIPTTIVSLVLMFGWLAHLMGVPALLGGFAAGLALSRGFSLPFGSYQQCDFYFSTEIEEQMRPIIQLFTPIFFVLVGLSLRLHEIEWRSVFVWGFSASLLLISVLGKLLGAMPIPEAKRVKWATGIAMIPRGEVGLIFAEVGRRADVFTNEIYASLVIVIALTTIFPPFLLRWFYERERGDAPGLRARE